MLYLPRTLREVSTEAGPNVSRPRLPEPLFFPKLGHAPFADRPIRKRRALGPPFVLVPRSGFQATRATPDCSINWCSSPASYISIMMSLPPTNSPLT